MVVPMGSESVKNRDLPRQRPLPRNTSSMIPKAGGAALPCGWMTERQQADGVNGDVRRVVGAVGDQRAGIVEMTRGEETESVADN